MYVNVAAASVVSEEKRHFETAAAISFCTITETADFGEISMVVFFTIPWEETTNFMLKFFEESTVAAAAGESVIAGSEGSKSSLTERLSITMLMLLDELFFNP